MIPRPPSVVPKGGGVPELDRIYTGDALSVLKGWPDRFVDLVVTDPPYGNAIAYGRAKRRIAGDENPLVGLMAMAEAYRVLKRNSNAYVFADIKHLGFIENFFVRYTGYRIRDVLIWDKAHMGLGYGFRRRYECIFALEKGKPEYRDKGLPNVIAVPRVNTKDHPHAKPVDLIKRLIRTSSDEGEIVLDPFVGSGTTCVAAAALGRRYLGIELSPAYAAIARKRLAVTDPSCSGGVFPSRSHRGTQIRPTTGGKMRLEKPTSYVNTEDNS